MLAAPQPQFAEKVRLIQDYRSLSLHNATMKVIGGVSLRFVVMFEIYDEKHLLSFGQAECETLFSNFGVHSLRELFGV